MKSFGKPIINTLVLFASQHFHLPLIF